MREGEFATKRHKIHKKDQSIDPDRIAYRLSEITEELFQSIVTSTLVLSVPLCLPRRSSACLGVALPALA